MKPESVARVFIAKGVDTLTLSLKQWELKQTATLTLDEARELVRMLSEAVLRKGIEAEEARLLKASRELPVGWLARTVTVEKDADGKYFRKDVYRTHGSAALDADAEKLIALGQDPGPVVEDFSDLL